MCKYCNKKQWNETANVTQLNCTPDNRVEGMGLYFHTEKKAWFLYSYSYHNKESRFQNMVGFETEVTHCPWCGRDLYEKPEDPEIKKYFERWRK